MKMRTIGSKSSRSDERVRSRVEREGMEALTGRIALTTVLGYRWRAKEEEWKISVGPGRKMKASPILVEK